MSGLKLQLILVATVACSTSIPSAAIQTRIWQDLAIDLFGDPKNRIEAIFELEKINDLEEKVRYAFGRPDQELALEVIRALGLTGFLPRIAKAIETTENSRLDGHFIQVASDIASKEDSQNLVPIFLNKLKQKDLAAPTIIMLLSTLAQLGAAPSSDNVRELLLHDSSEVRIAVARSIIGVTKTDESYSHLLPTLLASKPYQVRLVAIEGVRANRRLRKRVDQEVKGACAREANAKIATICREFK
jgi:hypothetical protein